MKFGLVFGSVLFLIAGITLAGNSQEVAGLSDLELTNIAANATGNATGAAMEEANKLLEAAKNATANATQAGIEQARSVMANVANNLSNGTSNTTGMAMNEANKLISAATPNATENTTGETQTYESHNTGIRLSYPLDWGNIDESGDCHKDGICAVSWSDIKFPFVLTIYPNETCKCNLMDKVRDSYESQSSSLTGFSFINDNQTVVGKNHSGWQYEFSYVKDGVNSKGISVFATNNGLYYQFNTVYPQELGVKQLPEVKKIIDSIEFLPVQVPKTPSFMNGSEMEQSNPSLPLESNPSGLQILSHNSFTDSVGYMHVVGEVQNNSPSTATYVEVTGTFYDSNNQVVGTQFTFTNPSDIAGGDKAPFDLTLLSASIPVSQVDHYNLVASYQ